MYILDSIIEEWNAVILFIWKIIWNVSILGKNKNWPNRGKFLYDSWWGVKTTLTRNLSSENNIFPLTISRFYFYRIYHSYSQNKKEYELLLRLTQDLNLLGNNDSYLFLIREREREKEIGDVTIIKERRTKTMSSVLRVLMIFMTSFAQ